MLGRLPIASDTYIGRCMADPYGVEVEPEVRCWLESPTATLAGSTSSSTYSPKHAETLGEQYTRHLDAKVRELRFHLLRQQTRVTYWLTPARRGVLLTVFR